MMPSCRYKSLPAMILLVFFFICCNFSCNNICISTPQNQNFVATTFATKVYSGLRLTRGKNKNKKKGDSNEKNNIANIKSRESTSFESDVDEISDDEEFDLDKEMEFAAQEKFAFELQNRSAVQKLIDYLRNEVRLLYRAIWKLGKISFKSFLYLMLLGFFISFGNKYFAVPYCLENFNITHNFERGASFTNNLCCGAAYFQSKREYNNDYIFDSAEFRRSCKANDRDAIRKKKWRIRSNLDGLKNNLINLKRKIGLEDEKTTSKDKEVENFVIDNAAHLKQYENSVFSDKFAEQLRKSPDYDEKMKANRDLQEQILKIHKKRQRTNPNWDPSFNPNPNPQKWKKQDVKQIDEFQSMARKGNKGWFKDVISAGINIPFAEKAIQCEYTYPKEIANVMRSWTICNLDLAAKTVVTNYEYLFYHCRLLVEGENRLIHKLVSVNRTLFPETPKERKIDAKHEGWGMKTSLHFINQLKDALRERPIIQQMTANLKEAGEISETLKDIDEQLGEIDEKIETEKSIKAGESEISQVNKFNKSLKANFSFSVNVSVNFSGTLNLGINNTNQTLSFSTNSSSSNSSSNVLRWNFTTSNNTRRIEKIVGTGEEKEPEKIRRIHKDMKRTSLLNENGPQETPQAPSQIHTVSGDEEFSDMYAEFVKTHNLGEVRRMQEFADEDSLDKYFAERQEKLIEAGKREKALREELIQADERIKMGKKKLKKDGKKKKKSNKSKKSKNARRKRKAEKVAKNEAYKSKKEKIIPIPDQLQSLLEYAEEHAGKNDPKHAQLQSDKEYLRNKLRKLRRKHAAGQKIQPAEYDNLHKLSAGVVDGEILEIAKAIFAVVMENDYQEIKEMEQAMRETENSETLEAVRKGKKTIKEQQQILDQMKEKEAVIIRTMSEFNRILNENNEKTRKQVDAAKENLRQVIMRKKKNNQKLEMSDLAQLGEAARYFTNEQIIELIQDVWDMTGKLDLEKTGIPYIDSFIDNQEKHRPPRKSRKSNFNGGRTLSTNNGPLRVPRKWPVIGKNGEIVENNDGNSNWEFFTLDTASSTLDYLNGRPLNGTFVDALFDGLAKKIMLTIAFGVFGVGSVLNACEDRKYIKRTTIENYWFSRLAFRTATTLQTMFSKPTTGFYNRVTKPLAIGAFNAVGFSKKHRKRAEKTLDKIISKNLQQDLIFACNGLWVGILFWLTGVGAVETVLGLVLVMIGFCMMVTGYREVMEMFR